jgi:undecaprenyl-phosphate 4-deoxy-4-formamido-L-arabinose transferase
MSDRLPSVSVVVPVYNSEESLQELIERLEAALGPATSTFEVVLVDDGSRDRSWSVIEDLATRHRRIRGLRLMRNYGQHNALLAGIRAARHEVIVTMDDDLQHRPEDIMTLVAALSDNVDLVYGTSIDEEHGAWRNVSSKVVKTSMASAVGNEMARMASAFRAFRGELRRAFAETSDPFVSIDVLLSWATVRISSVKVQMDTRRYGKSGYTFRKLVRHSINMMTGYSSVPLRLVTYVGFGFAFMGLIVLGYVLIRFAITDNSVPGFPFLASIVAIFSGAQLFALGVLGEYLGRMHFRSMQRPPFTVRTWIGGSDESGALDAPLRGTGDGSADRG